MPYRAFAVFALALLTVIGAGRVLGQPVSAGESAERDVRALIDAWYGELRRGEDGRPWMLFTPGAIIAARAEPINAKPGARGLTPIGPPFPNELIRRAEKFDFAIERLRLEGGLAKVVVRERGWIYAWAAKQTYRNDAEARFVLERSADGRWLILAFDSNGDALRPQDRDDPMPDLSPEGKRSRP